MGRFSKSTHQRQFRIRNMWRLGLQYLSQTGSQGKTYQTARLFQPICEYQSIFSQGVAI